MKPIETRLNKRFGIDVDLFIMFYDDPSLKENILSITGLSFETIRNTMVFMESNEDKASVIYMLLKTLK